MKEITAKHIDRYIKENLSTILEYGNLKELNDKQKAFEEAVSREALQTTAYFVAQEWEDVEGHRRITDPSDAYLMNDSDYEAYIKARYALALEKAPTAGLKIEAETYEYNLFYKTDEKLRKLRKQILKGLFGDDYNVYTYEQIKTEDKLLQRLVNAAKILIQL